MSDVCGPARRLQVLRVIDDYGRLGTIVSNNGRELISRAVLEWQNRTRIAWHHIAPGKPQQKRLA